MLESPVSPVAFFIGGSASPGPAGDPGRSVNGEAGTASLGQRPEGAGPVYAPLRRTSAHPLRQGTGADMMRIFETYRE